MGTIARFDNCKISVYADHAPPHFHIQGPEIDAVVAIDTLQVTEGDVRKAASAMAWAGANRDLLMRAWLELNKRRG